MTMLTHYMGFTIIANEETSVPQVMGALYEKVHLALAENRSENIDVSFPQYCMTAKWLGSVLRLHGSQADLDAVVASEWLKGVRDYVHIGNINAVPEEGMHRIVYRKQFKANVERLRRRRMRRKQETAEQVAQAIPGAVTQSPNLPYISLCSRSTGQRFSLFIGMGPLQESPASGAFSFYGLSSEVTVPWFWLQLLTQIWGLILYSLTVNNLCNRSDRKVLSTRLWQSSLPLTT